MLFVGAKLAPRVPWGLVVLIVAIVGSGAWNLSERGVATVGEVPTGFPPFGLPGVGLADLGPIVTSGLALGLVGLAEGLSAARLLAARGNYTVDTDQELIATGAANLGSGLSAAWEWRVRFRRPPRPNGRAPAPRSPASERP